MKKYFSLQLKRVLRLTPFILVAMVALVLCILAVFSQLIVIYTSSEENQKSHFALCGDIEGTYLEMGLEALKAVDSTRYTIEFEMMEQEEALKLLEAGRSSACIVIPENFAYEIYYHGNVLPVTYITSGDSVGITPFLKDELTSVISDALTEGMKCVYGASRAARGEDVKANSANLANDMSIDYVECIIKRSNAYEVTELGFADSQNLWGYMFCGISVMLILLLTLPFAMLYVKRDYSLQRIYCSKGKGAFIQILSEFGAFFVGIFLLYLLLSLCIALAGAFTDLPVDAVISTQSPVYAFLCSVPAVLMLCALSFLFFEISGDLVSGILSLFFTSVFLCYAGGCLYPNFIFPETLQKIVAWLPTAIARAHLGAALNDGDIFLTAVRLFAYTAVFLCLAVLARHRKLKANGGDGN